MSMNINDVVKNIDWAELRVQKAALISYVDHDPILEGIVNLIDNIQDAAIDSNLATFSEVFDIELEDE